MAKESWFEISNSADLEPRNEGGRVARVDIMGPIGGWDVSGSEFLRELKDLGDVDSIDLRIHSPGGSVLDGWAIANGIKNHPAHVVARVEGLAASMGSVVLMSADEIEVPQNAYVMIHNVSGGAFGEADELESMAALMRKLQDDVTDVYANATGKDREKIADMMAAETWMNGEDAVEHGFATRVLETVKAAACADLETLVSKFENVPEAVLELQAEEPHLEEDQVDEVEDLLEEDQAQESGDQEAADIEADQEEIEEELQDEVKAKKELSAWARILAALSGDKCADNHEGSSARAALQRAEKLEAELSGRVDELEKVQAELEILRAENKELESCALTVESRLIECGFDFAEASDLPAPNANKIGNVLETYLAMQPGQERREFFAKNRKEIERLQSE
jgi:ATP-dependent Clp endopeptidase proteolytic subunit ClpP